MCVLRLRKTKQKGESPSVIKGPDAHTEEYGLYSEGGGGGPLRQSARSVLYNQAVPPLSRAYLHAQEDQGPGGGLLVGQGEWLPKLPWAILSVGSSVSSMTYFSPSLCQSCWALTK